MNKSDLEKRIKEIDNELLLLKYLRQKLLDNPTLLSDEERQQFIQDNSVEVEKWQRLMKERTDLSWKLMSKEEQQMYIDKYSQD